MEFNFVDGAHFATNSIKPVRITQYEEDCFELFMLKGDLNIHHPISTCFETFDEAVRWAECQVGIEVKMSDFEIENLFVPA